MERRDTHASELTVRIRTGALLTLILLGAFQARQVPGILEGLSTLLGLLGCFELLRAMGLLQGRWGWLVYAGTALCCLLFPLYIPRLPIPVLAAAEGAAAAAGLLSLLLSGCGPFPGLRIYGGSWGVLPSGRPLPACPCWETACLRWCCPLPPVCLRMRPPISAEKPWAKSSWLLLSAP